MQVILQGSLRHFPPQELLTFLLARNQRGTLDLEASPRRTRILFDRDRIVWAEANDNTPPLEAVLSTFEWTAGTFTLLDALELPEGATAVALDMGPLLEEAERRAQQALLFPDATLFRVVEDPAMQHQVSLTVDQLKLLFRLTSGRTFANLVEELGLPKREVAERLRELSSLGLIAIEAPEVASRPKTAARRVTLVGSLTPDDSPDNVYPLLEAEHTIGRAPANSVTLNDGSVSSTHARILKTPEGFVLEDLKSRNGTFVNGERVEGKRLLADGDLIRLGKVILTFNVARDAITGEITQPEIRVG